MKLCLKLLVAAFSIQFAGATGYLVRPGTMIDDCETATPWKITDFGSLSLDKTNFKHGAAGLRLTSDPDLEVDARRAISVDLSTTNTFSFWIHVESDVSFQPIAVGVLFSSNNFDSYFQAQTANLHAGWNKVLLCKQDFEAIGSASWSQKMTGMQFELFNQLGGIVTATIDDIEYGEYTRPKVILSFDDGPADDYLSAMPYMSANGMAGTAYIISSYIDHRQGFMTTAMCQALYNSGWDLANHTTTHPDLTTLTQAQAKTEFTTCAQFLSSHGWTRNNAYLHLAYPYGLYNQTTLNAAAAAGILSARGTLPARQADELDEKYQIYSMVPDGYVNTAQDTLDRVDQVIATGGMLQFTFHELVDGDPQDTTDWRIADFQTLVDYLVQQRDAGLLDVVTYSDWYNGLVAPQLTKLTISPASVLGGVSATGTVTLATPAPAGGTVVTLSDQSAVIVTPPSVTVPAGLVSANFTLATSPILSTSTFKITAQLGTTTLTAPLTVQAAASTLTGFTVSPTSVTGGSNSTGTVTLAAAAPSGGVTVTLNRNSNLVAIPSTVKVAAGSKTATFTITSQKVASNQTITLTAALNGYSIAKSLTLKP